MDQELKPCPFCGGTDLDLVDIGEGFTAIACNTCDAFGPMGPGEEGAAAEWNERVLVEDPY